PAGHRRGRPDRVRGPQDPQRREAPPPAAAQRPHPSAAVRGRRRPPRPPAASAEAPGAIHGEAQEALGPPSAAGQVPRPLGRRLYPVGRLDADTTGLILLTNDGELANRLMHPRYEVPRVYRARVKGRPDDTALRRLRKGVELDDGVTARAEVRRVAPGVLEL